MKICLIICTLFLTQVPLFGQGKDTVPEVVEVARMFYSHYSTESLEYKNVFFEKRPQGWFIITKKIINNKVVDDKRILFYDFSSGKFSDLDFVKVSREISNPDQYVDPYDRQFFDLYPYYGYDGWYKDVINKLEGQPKPGDQELYALARAYSAFASSLLSNQIGYAMSEESFNPPLKLNCLSWKQIQRYEEICGKAINLFEKLKKQNSNFKTTVGNISIKYGNEVMVRFHNLMAYATDYAKGIKLPDNIYPDSVIAFARNWMNNCPRNAIFLSFGDNDFYPLLYLQQHDSLRRDIYVVSYNLLGVPRFIYNYSKPLFDAKPVELAADSTLYTNEYNYYIYLKESDKIISLNQMLDTIRSRAMDEIPALDGNTFYINLKKERQQVSIVSKIKVEERYIALNQWILLDMLEHLNTRPFILPNEFYDQLKNLNTYLDWNGNVFRYLNF